MKNNCLKNLELLIIGIVLYCLPSPIQANSGDKDLRVQSVTASYDEGDRKTATDTDPQGTSVTSTEGEETAELFIFPKKEDFNEKGEFIGSVKVHLKAEPDSDEFPADEPFWSAKISTKEPHNDNKDTDEAKEWDFTITKTGQYRISATYINTVRVRVTVVPVDIKINQTVNSPYGSPPKYKNSPKAYPASNLFSIWPNEKATIKLKLPAPFDNEEKLPPDLIKWTVPGYTIANNTLEPEVSWALGGPGGGTKEIKIKVADVEYKVHIQVQGVGFLTQKDCIFLVPNAVAAGATYNKEAQAFGKTYKKSPQQDAMRHSYFNSLCVSTFGVTSGDMEILSTAHEFDNRTNKQQAFNSTMDLHNNSVGMSVNTQINGLPDRAATKTILDQKYAAGEMYVWEIPKGYADASQGTSEGILVWSNGKRIYP